MTKSLKKAVEAEKQRLAEKLAKTEPGTAAYAELQKQLGGFTIMEEKDRDGKMTPADWVKLGGTLVSTGLVITADQWFPQVAGKLRLSDFVGKLFK